MTPCAMMAREAKPKKKQQNMQAVGSEGIDRSQNGGIPPSLTISMASLCARSSRLGACIVPPRVSGYGGKAP